MKTQVTFTLEDEDIDIARSLAMSRNLTCRGGNLGPEIRGNVAALFRELLHEEIDRMIDNRDESSRTVEGGN